MIPEQFTPNPTTSISTLGASRLDRRAIMRGGIALGAGLASAGNLVRLTSAQTDDGTPAAAVSLDEMTPAIVDAANAFLDALSDDERAAVLFDWSDTAQKQRWSNFPEGLFERDGLMWGDLADAPREAWLALMRATLSETGYERVMAEWEADQVLADSGGGMGGGNGGGPGGGGGMGQMLGTDHYWVALIGEPSATESWQWQFGGHHITVNATVAGDRIALTPSFIGVQPASWTDADGTTIRPLGDIEDDAFALVNALDDDQRAAAILGDEYINLLLGPGEDGGTIEPEGLPGVAMTDEQREMVLSLVSRYTGMVHDAVAADRLAEVEETLDDTYLAWYGPTEPGSAAYFRVAGSRIVIEYSPQGMGGDAANHIHGIYRDPENDYGALITG
jgi:hypothetical protein